MSELVAVFTGVLGLAGLIFAALKYNRADATEVVNQQSTLLDNMRVLTDEIQEALVRCRDQREEIAGRLRQTEEAAKALYNQHQDCEQEIQRLQAELAALREGPHDQ